MRSNRAFTLIELLIVIGIIAVLTTILIPVITTTLRDSEKTVCQTKLGTIVNSYAKYDDDPGGFARHVTYGDPDATVVGKSGNDKLRGTLGENAMQTVWELIDAGYLPPIAFKCPADDDHAPKTTPNKFGWDSWYQFSYGIQNPYDGDDATPTTPNAARPDKSAYKANQIFFADMNPGGKASADNSADDYYSVATRRQSNHADGCNVATRNGNVWFHNDEGSSVVYGEEIYENDAGSDDPWPDTTTDVVITPRDPLGVLARSLP